jgi:hypothetical protein
MTTQDQPETPEEPGSIPLKNARHEKFAQRLSWGVSQAKSYILAGYPESGGTATNASRLAKNPDVVARVAWLKLKVAEAHIYDAAKIEERLAYMADALSEIVIDPDTGLRKPGPMFNANAAARVLELLGRKHGIFKDKIELGGNVSVGNTDLIRRMKPDQRSALKALLLQAQQQAPANDDDPVEQAEEPAATGVVK